MTPGFTTIAQQNAIDRAVHRLQDGIEGMEIGTAEGGTTYLTGDDLPEDFCRKIITETCEEYCNDLTQARQPKARSGDPGTSARAAYENLPRRKTQHRKILDLMADQPGRALSAEWISKLTQIRLNSISTRMSELVRTGWVEVADQNGKRSVYRLTDRGLLRYRLQRQQQES